MGSYTATVDVRDMVCAQALALVARAAGRTLPGAALLVHYNAEDVKRDLVVWGAQHEHTIEEVGPDRLRIIRGAAG